MSDKRPTPAPVDKSEGPKPIAAAAAKALEEARATAAKAPPADPERIPDPKPTLARRPANGKLPEDWAHSAEGIEHAAASLGIARLDFEDDAALVARINTTLHLFQ